MTFQSINPYTETPSEETPYLSDTEAQTLLNKTQSCYETWRRIPLEQRCSKLNKLASELKSHLSPLSAIITEEMGKPITQAQNEIQKSADLCTYYAKNSPCLLSFPEPEIQASPLGIILGIMPWNFPIWQVMRFAIPTLTIGNAALIKHAPNMPQTADYIQTLFHNANIQAYQNAFLNHKQIETLIPDPRITGISLTGSDRAGRAIGTLAGKHLKKCILELGGSDPFIVCEDANIEEAIKSASQARHTNAGQVCIAPKRFILHKNIYNIFLEGYLETLKNIRLGDPQDPNTTLGPLAKKSIQQTLHTQIQKSIAIGATALHGGHPTKAPTGFFYTPTLLSNITPTMPVWTQETFGPVSPCISANTTQDLLNLANNTPYGLGASIWTQNPETATHLATHIQAGNIAINKPVTSIQHLPFGGIKNSGFGNELGREGLLAFSNLKTVI